MAKRAKLQTSRRIPVREEKRPVVDSIVPILQQQQEVSSFASPFDTAQDAFAPEFIAEDIPQNQEPFNIQTFWDTLYQTAGPTVEQTGRLAMNPNDPNFGNLATGRSEQGFEDLVYTPFHQELQAQGIPLYQVDEEGNRLYINLPQGVSAIPESERSKEFHPELFDRFGNYIEGTWEDVSGGEAGIGEYSRRFVETPDYNFFEDILGDPRINLFASAVPGGQAAMSLARAASGQTLHASDWLNLLSAGADQYQQQGAAAQTTAGSQAGLSAGDIAVNDAITSGVIDVNDINAAAQAQQIADAANAAAATNDFLLTAGQVGLDVFTGGQDPFTLDYEQLATDVLSDMGTGVDPRVYFGAPVTDDGLFTGTNGTGRFAENLGTLGNLLTGLGGLGDSQEGRSLTDLIELATSQGLDE